MVFFLYSYTISNAFSLLEILNPIFLLPLLSGLEKPEFRKKPSTVVFYIFAQKREFLGFFSFKNTFRCIQTLNYNHSY
jgi:hypothetical protein